MAQFFYDLRSRILSNGLFYLALPVIRQEAFLPNFWPNPIYSFNDTSDDNYDADYSAYDYQYETSDNTDESYATSYYEEENNTQLVNDTMYDTSSTVTANFLSDLTTTESSYSSANSSISSQSETVVPTTIALDTIEGTLHFLYSYMNAIL